MRGSSFKQIELSKLNRFIQIKPQQLFTGKETTVLKSLPAAVVVSYFTASEKENLRTKRKQNYVIKNEKRKKNSDYYYLSNRLEKWSK